MTHKSPNILFIVMDTARAQTVFDDEGVMPNFHEMASEGTLFTNAFATAPWTLPSHASMFTGQYTSDHETHAGNKLFDPGVPTLAERLQDSGYLTVGFSNNVWISPEFGFDRGFDTLRTNMQFVKGGADITSIAKHHSGITKQAWAASKTLLRPDIHRTLINGVYAKFLRGRYDSGARLTNWRIKRWLSSHANQENPFFMFVNYLEPHLEYDPPKEFKYKFKPDNLTYSDLDSVNQDSWSYICDQVEMNNQDFDALSALYKAELNYLDYRLGKLFRLLEEKKIMDETMIVIVGDHGENIGDHDLMDHQYCLYDTLLHVPLLIRYPENFPTDERCKKRIELRDILPTILEATDIELPNSPTVSSKSLQKTLSGKERDHTIAEYLTPQPSMSALEQRTGALPKHVEKYDRSLRSIRKNQWKLIIGSDGSTKLYNTEADPTERCDVSKENKDMVEDCELLLSDSLNLSESKDHTYNHDVNSATQKRLEDLGYL